MTTAGISVVGFVQKSGENLEAASKSKVAHGFNSTILEGHSQSLPRLIISYDSEETLTNFDVFEESD